MKSIDLISLISRFFFSFLLVNRYKSLALKLHFDLFCLLFFVVRKRSKESCCLCSQYASLPLCAPLKASGGAERHSEEPCLQDLMGCCPRSGACWGSVPSSLERKWSKVILMLAACGKVGGVPLPALLPFLQRLPYITLGSSAPFCSVPVVAHRDGRAGIPQPSSCHLLVHLAAPAAGPRGWRAVPFSAP